MGKLISGITFGVTFCVAIACKIANIWTVDERWNTTAGVFGGIAAVIAIVWLFIWLFSDAEDWD